MGLLHGPCDGAARLPTVRCLLRARPSASAWQHLAFPRSVRGLVPPALPCRVVLPARGMRSIGRTSRRASRLHAAHLHTFSRLAPGCLATPPLPQLAAKAERLKRAELRADVLEVALQQRRLGLVRQSTRWVTEQTLEQRIQEALDNPVPLHAE